MGYTTEFQGAFKISPPLRPEDLKKLQTLAETRHGDNMREWKGYPSLYCQWVPSKDGTLLHWDGEEKFYGYKDWLVHIIQNYLIPGKYQLDGKVNWIGEDKFNDQGTITVKANEVKLKKT